MWGREEEKRGGEGCRKSEGRGRREGGREGREEGGKVWGREKKDAGKVRDEYTFPPATLLPFKKVVLVSGCEATHCSRARALHTLFDCWAWVGPPKLIYRQPEHSHNVYYIL